MGWELMANCHVGKAEIGQIRNEIGQLRNELRNEMIQLRNSVHSDMVSLHERVAVMEAKHGQ